MLRIGALSWCVNSLVVFIPVTNQDAYFKVLKRFFDETEKNVVMGSIYINLAGDQLNLHELVFWQGNYKFTAA